MKLVAVAAFLFALSAYARSPIPIGGRCGGDGPRPLTASAEFADSDLELLPAENSIKEATLLGGQEEIAYRNEYNRVFRMDPDFPSGQVELAPTAMPLSPLSDLSGRFLLSAGFGAILDLAGTDGWRSFLSVTPVTHGFWNGSTLYSLQTQKAADGSLGYQAYRLGPTDRIAVPICTFPKPSGLPVSLAHGHAYPNFFFYRSRPTVDGPILSYWKFNPISCTTQEYEFVEPFLGSITSVYRYEALNSTLVIVDHPKTNLFWHSGTSCRYFDRGTDKVLPLRFDKPIVGTWSKLNGANLVFLNQEKRARILEDLRITNMTGGDLMLTNSGKILYATAQVDDYKLLARLWLSKRGAVRSPHPEEK